MLLLDLDAPELIRQFPDMADHADQAPVHAEPLNACLTDLAGRFIDGLAAALRELDLTCPLYLTQNDRTLMTAEVAGATRCTPSRAARRTRCAARRSCQACATGIVVDVGGVRTNFRMPDVWA